MILKKYCYTINHKRIGLNYFYFSLWTGCSGALLATMIRFEMALPGSPFFKGDSLRYLQVMTAHALIMIFFVVVPIFFGGFANFLLPYHVGSKDVAFPRLNSIGFWIQPCGYLLIAKIGFIRQQYWHYYDKPVFYFPMTSLDKYNIETIENYSNAYRPSLLNLTKLPMLVDMKKKQNTTIDTNIRGNSIFESIQTIHSTTKGNGLVTIAEKSLIPLKLLLWLNNYSFPENFWYVASRVVAARRRKRFVAKCASSTQTVAGWTFITPFSSDTRFTGYGVQDMLITGVYYAGISTTISLTNLLVTRRTLTMSGLKSRRILLPFTSITLLLMLRALAVITPVLGSAMLMLLLDRHWKTSFFDFAYGGDPVLFHHLFWFFGHPEVYVLVIPAFGIINVILPYNNTRRVASKHHLIWAIYVMNYMGFIVWGHHMYLIGLDHRSRALYSTITIMISMPATIKVVNWTFSLVNGALKVDAAAYACISFIFFFLVAGFTGMWLSHVSLNISMHDSMYVVAHFHLMLSGSVIMSIFAGFYYYFSAFFSLKYAKTWAYVHIIYYTGGQWMTFLPLFWVAFSGLPRRLHDFPAIYTGWQSMATVGHFITMAGVAFFYFMLYDSTKSKKSSVILSLMIPRLNKRVLYYLHKGIYFAQWLKKTSNLPKKLARLHILLNNTVNKEHIVFLFFKKVAIRYVDLRNYF